MVGLMIVCVDVDGPCADLLPAWLRLHEEMTGEYIHPADVDSWDLSKIAMRGNIYDVLHRDDLYDWVEPVDGAVQAIEAMRQKGHDVLFVTSSNEVTAGQKNRWLVKHGFTEYRSGGHLPDVIHCSRKSLIRGDMLIDDGVHNLRGFGGQRILWDAPYNRSEAQFRRVTCWDEVTTLVLPVVEIWR